MKVEIRKIEIARDYESPNYVDKPDRRDIEALVVDQYRKPLTFRLPSIEVDGLIVVGGIYELMFARRES